MEKMQYFYKKMKNKNILININLTRKMNFFEWEEPKNFKKMV